jgi:hypothetical protein
MKRFQYNKKFPRPRQLRGALKKIPVYLEIGRKTTITSSLNLQNLTKRSGKLLVLSEILMKLIDAGILYGKVSLNLRTSLLI